jgi:hypothetical protein
MPVEQSPTGGIFRFDCGARTMLDRIRAYQGADQIDLFGQPKTTIITRLADALFRLLGR